jgi:hypothetical protein
MFSFTVASCTKKEPKLKYFIDTSRVLYGKVTLTINGEEVLGGYEGEVVTFEIIPIFGYSLNSFSAYLTSNPSALISISNMKFTIPKGEVTLVANFEKIVVDSYFKISSYYFYDEAYIQIGETSNVPALSGTNITPSTVGITDILIGYQNQLTIINSSYILDLNVPGTVSSGMVLPQGQGELELKFYFVLDTRKITVKSNTENYFIQFVGLLQKDKNTLTRINSSLPGYSIKINSFKNSKNEEFKPNEPFAYVYSLPYEDIYIDLFITPNTNTPFRINVFLENAIGQYELVSKYTLILITDDGLWQPISVAMDARGLKYDDNMTLFRGTTDAYVNALNIINQDPTLRDIFQDMQKYGFEFDENNPNNVKEGTISGLGDLVLALYFNRYHK